LAEIEDAVIVPAVPVRSDVSAVDNPPPAVDRVNNNSGIDRVNNIAQKELALEKEGVTRRKYIRVIAEALEATSWVDEYDEQGNEISTHEELNLPNTEEITQNLGITFESVVDDDPYNENSLIHPQA